MAEPKWREGFPIEWEKDHYVTRRELAKFLTLGSALLVGANTVIAAVGRMLRTPQFPAQQIAQLAEVSVGAAFLFRYPTERDPCILINTPSGPLAYSQVCTHLSCAVVHEPGSDQLFCPCHHGYFSLRSGRPTAGPPTRRLPRIKLEQRDGAIYAVGVEV